MQKICFSFVDKNLDKAQQEVLGPKRQSRLASGLDLACAHAEPIVIEPGERALISTGICIELIEGLEGQVRGRSGLAFKHGLMVLNSPGTIDADYRGEIKVILANLSKQSFTVSFGMRIAQLVIAPVRLVDLTLVDALGKSTRGEGGFGSTGVATGSSL